MYTPNKCVLRENIFWAKKDEAAVDQANGRAGTDGPIVHCAKVEPHRRKTVFGLV